jgi:DNA gyrase/topoisomerase IV subunit B
MIQTFLFNVVKTKVADPEFTGTVESLSRENKHIILETEDDALIECIIKWLSMYNKTVQHKIMEKVVKQETKEEVEVEVEEEQKEPQEPTVPPPTTVSMECQTDDSFLSETEAGSSSQKEEPVPPEGSAQTEVSGEP